jgi:hypothetical protein
MAPASLPATLRPARAVSPLGVYVCPFDFLHVKSHGASYCEDHHFTAGQRILMALLPRIRSTRECSSLLRLLHGLKDVMDG